MPTERPTRRSVLRAVVGTGLGSLGVAGAAGCTDDPRAGSPTATDTTPAGPSSRPWPGGSHPPTPSATVSATRTPTPTPPPSGTLTASLNASSAPAIDAQAAAAAMPLRAALAQLLVVGLSTIDSGACRTLVSGAGPVGGVFLSKRDLRQLSPTVLARIRAARVPVIVAVDDEGGRVQLTGAGSRLPSARSMARTLSPDQVRRVAADRGRLLAAHGVTMVFAPDGDVSSQPDRAVIGDRAFSHSPTTVLRYATAYARGLVDAGLTPVVKHFPGHGRAVGDSHLTLPRTPPVAELAAVDWVPIRGVISATPAAVMMGHLSVPGLSTSGVPSSVDPAVYAALRTRVGFAGVVVTDELASMRSVSARYGLGDAVRLSLAAGADLALFNAGDNGVRLVSQILNTLERAVAQGTLPRARVLEATARVLTLKQVSGGRG